MNRTTTLLLSDCPLLNPPFKLVLPKPPHTPNLESWELALSGQAGHRKGVELEDPGDLIRGESLDGGLHSRASGCKGGEELADYNKSNDKMGGVLSVWLGLEEN